MFFTDAMKDKVLQIACQEDFLGCDAICSLWDEIYTKTSVSKTELALFFYNYAYQTAAVDMMNSVNDFDEESGTFEISHTPFSEVDADTIRRHFGLIE